MTRKRTLIAVLTLGTVLVVAAWAWPGNALHDAKRATKQYKDVSVAEHAGYMRFLDKDQIACIDNPPEGGMGIHYVNQTYVGDAEVTPTKPEAVVYKPRRDGSLRLGALEYIVFQAAWDANHKKAPSLFGEKFMLTPDGNRFGIPAFYSLHVWIYKHNPAGTFAMWNPRVKCPAAGTASSSDDDDMDMSHEEMDD
jgi:hypothetical protein